MSKHVSPLLIDAPQPRQGHALPAAATLGTPAEPLIREGMLFLDILKPLNFPCQIIQDFTKADYSDSKFLRRPFRTLSTGAETFIQLLIYHLECCDKVVLRSYTRL